MEIIVVIFKNQTKHIITLYGKYEYSEQGDNAGGANSKYPEEYYVFSRIYIHVVL
jgi:hypothetical protein